ncbi:MAG: hypothetical protein JWR90_2531, partial [Marmoricola sp.]|nr:hypothetical protein [Marmoricola sp.]
MSFTAWAVKLLLLARNFSPEARVSHLHI